MRFSRNVQQFERNRAIELPHRKTSESNDSIYTHKWKRTPLNQQNALELHAERAGGVLYVHKCAKVVVRVIENFFRTEEVQVRVSSDNSSEGIRYMDPISKVVYRNFAIANCNTLYSNALELKNGSWITYGRQIELTDKPDEMPTGRVNVNWSNTAPMKGLFNDDELELSKTAQRLR